MLHLPRRCMLQRFNKLLPRTTSFFPSYQGPSVQLQEYSMQRPRNRQNRPSCHTDRGRESGPSRSKPRPSSAAVPRITEVVAGAPVSIVLKIDQRTGNEVQGFVSEVLTRGNHPRGIKVRLVDGRVGRVQRMATESEAKVGSEGLSGLGRNGETSSAIQGQGQVSEGVGGVSGRRGMSTSTTRVASRYRDMRGDEHEQLPATGYSLEDFLPNGHPLRATQRGDLDLTATLAEDGAATHTCPVCGEFEGDEFAVSQHVGAHFD